MKIVFSAVGNRDPYPIRKDGSIDLANPGSILQGVEHLRPDVVYLLPTEGSDSATKENGEATKATLQECYLDKLTVHLRPLNLPDPTAYEQVVTAFGEAVRAAMAECGEGHDYHVLLSSGAPQFRLAWSLLVLNGRLPARCWEVRDPRFPGDRVWEANIGFLEEPTWRRRFEDAWRVCDFAAAQRIAREWARRSPNTERQMRTAWVAELMSVYRNLDAVDWNAAREELRKRQSTVTVLSQFPALTAVLQNQATALDSILLLGSDEGWWNLIDLYHNALRRLEAGQPVDALARFRRIVEGAAFALLRVRGCQIDGEWALLPDDFDQSLIGQVPRGVNLRRDAHWRVGLSVPVALFLARMTANLDEKLTESIGGYMDPRNRSIAAHGMEPVEKKTAQRALGRAADLLRAAFPDAPALEDYPFSVSALRRMEPLLVEALGL